MLLSFFLHLPRATFAPMKLINSDAQLRLLIPHAIATVEGEVPLYDKLRPYLEEAEAWAAETFTSADVLAAIAALDDAAPVRTAMARLVAMEAYRTALPMLDLVLTPNGFGIVATPTLAPASRERVERLATSLTAERDAALERLLTLLPKLAAWPATPQAEYFGATLFPSLDLTHTFPPTADRWALYQSLRQRLLAIESHIAALYLGDDLMQALRREHLLGTAAGDRRNLAQHLRAVEVAMLHDEQAYEPRLLPLVEYVRQRPDTFPEWHQGAIKDLWAPPVYKNRKEDNAYWF